MGWFALMAPPGTPEPIARKISGDLNAVLARPDVRQRLTDFGNHVEPMAPAELLAFIRSQQQAWKPVLAAIAAQAPQ